MERAREQPRRSDDALIVPVGAREEEQAPAPARLAAPPPAPAPIAPIGTPVGPVEDWPAPAGKKAVAPAAQPRPRVLEDGYTEDGAALPPRARRSRWRAWLATGLLLLLALG